MMSFLLLVDLDGTIIEIKWCSPVTLIDEKVNKIQNIFANQTNQGILKFISECSNSSTKLCHLDNQELLIDQKLLKLYGVQSNNGVYIFAIDHQFCMDPVNNDQFRNLIARFMFLLQINDHHRGFQNPEASRFQFEEIQLLNNELVNTKRMLEKSNAQLNVLNKELNNRLVKDPLTGLVSRYQYRSEIEYQINQHQEKIGVFMFIDIDDFKSINDTYGHQTGDDYLVEFANRLRRIPLPNSVKLRIAGDEFGIFVYGLQTVDASILKSYWELIKTYITDDPVVINQRSLELSLSVGMAVYGVDTKEIYEIIEYADYAMYCAKKAGKNRYARFNREEYLRIKQIKNEV